jgi:uncharacterized protein
MKLNTKKLIQKLKQYPNILAVYLFGSYIRGNKGKLSDIDIGIIFENPTFLNNAKKSLKTYEELFDIFTLFLKNTDKLDLVFLQQTPLSLQKEVITEGLLVYANSVKEVLDFKEKVLIKFSDLNPLYKKFYQNIYKTI